MTEVLRKLLESYPGMTPPMRVQTDLSAAKIPSYAVTQRDETLVRTDVLGRESWRGSYALHIRQAAMGENDRQRVYRFLKELGDWISTRTPENGLPAGEPGKKLTGAVTKAPALQEAYDDGTAAWAMGILLEWETE